YVRRLMATLERDLGRKVEWAAVNHFDTSHPHAHIVVRGIDRDGRELRIDRSYISAGMRWRAQELATEELAPRPRPPRGGPHAGTERPYRRVLAHRTPRASRGPPARRARLGNVVEACRR